MTFELFNLFAFGNKTDARLLNELEPSKQSSEGGEFVFSDKILFSLVRLYPLLNVTWLGFYAAD